MSATIRDIRRLTGLSLATISKYLNGGNVLPENRARIEKAIDDLGYEVNEIARWLATNRTKTVGVIVFNIQSLFNSTLLSAISSELRNVGYGMLICDSADNAEQEAKNIRFLLSKKVDGILAIPVNGDRHEFGQASDAGVPVILLDRPLSGRCCVKIDNVRAAREAASLLIANGHRRIAVIGSDLEYTGRKRVEGFLSALEDHGSLIHPELVRIGKASIQFGYESMKRFLEADKMPTAAFMTNYEITLGAVMAVNESAVRCPEDISLLGFDNLILSQIVRPKMTMVVQPMQEMGKKAVEILLDQMTNASLQPVPEEINLPTSIEEGNSIRKIC